MTTVDVVTKHHGSFVTFELISDRALVWFAENVSTEAWQWMQNVCAVEHRYAVDLLVGLVRAGFQCRDAESGRLAREVRQ